MNTAPNNTRIRRYAGGLLALAIVAGGCGTVQPFSPQLTTALATANETVNQARAADAAQYAPLELQAAEQKLAAAQIAIAKKDNELAGRLAGEAVVDARLATVKSHSAKSQAVARDLQNGIQMLRDEIARKKNG